MVRVGPQNHKKKCYKFKASLVNLLSTNLYKVEHCICDIAMLLCVSSHA